MGSGSSLVVSPKQELKGKDKFIMPRPESMNVSFSTPPAILLYGPPIYPVAATAMYLSKKLMLPVLSSDTMRWTKENLKERINSPDCNGGFILCQYPMTVRDILEFSNLLTIHTKVVYFLGVDAKPESATNPSDLFALRPEGRVTKEKALLQTFYEYKNQEAIIMAFYQSEKETPVNLIDSNDSAETQIYESLCRITSSQNRRKSQFRRNSQLTEVTF